MTPRSPLCTAILALAFSAIGTFASTGTSMQIAKQAGAPASLIQTTHGLSDWLTAARLQSHSEKTITSYKIGWVYIFEHKAEFHTGPSMSVPAGIHARSSYDVSAQAVLPRAEAHRVIFYVAEVRFADGSYWKSRKGEICSGQCE